MQKEIIHIILKWNEAKSFHVTAPDTILLHCEILNKYSDSKDNQYVWWGKISVSGYLGLDSNDLELLNSQIQSGIATYIFLYCPDKRTPTMHIGKLSEITTQDMSMDIHTPLYYKDLRKNYNIPFWFKIIDILEIPFSTTLSNLKYLNGKTFDPVSVNFYPQKIQLVKNYNYFKYEHLYKSIFGGKIMRCFKTGSVCTRIDEIIYNPKQIFIGCPFKKEYFNMVNYVIKPVCEEMEYTTWIASDSFKNIDVMCKVCGGIQSSSRAIIDITTWNANVLFELGLLYGLGKNVLLIKHDNDDVPVDLRGIEYVRYDMNDFDSAKNIISKYLKNG